MTLQVSYTGRNIQIPSDFKEHVEEKVDKIDQLADKGQRLEVKVSSENSHRRADTALTVELTVVGRGKVVRSEAQAEDKFQAFEISLNKLTERLRRARDKKKSRAHNSGGAPDVASALAGLPPVASDRPLYEQVLDAEQVHDLPPGEGHDEDAPIRIRRKVFPAEPMTVDAAVDAMELIGHDFFLYIDAETNLASAVYRRRGWTYGVISLDSEKDAQDEPTTEERNYRAENGAA
ncbi:ribosome hibernation-promoting factor, HPF/YfiA family [Nesterenkonia aerolata]|uniref:Ribosome hibernation promoting factor n=1 Tax=Nesterenkonia aerolata TaxID=3074079 RepID=A0ABU2DNL1_9MICC|nr:ribosome-associated translation inhibitor RaiA [Nesterenkonia sp. LY-0111]MDR8018107.1 ribosome-associated translation inhibitor RaiA [Nesterenkonia sp. LY-0111]